MAEFETEPSKEEEKPFFKTPLGIIVIIVGVLVACCIIGSIASIAGLTLLGSEVEEVFKEVEQTLSGTATAEAGQ